MALNAKAYKQESKFKEPEPLEAGSYPARLVQIISLGLHPQEYMGEEKPSKHEVRAVYELADEFLVDEDGNDIEDKPRWIDEEFTMNSLDSDLAKSTKRYFALDPEYECDGDWTKLLGRPCMVVIVQNKGKGKNKDRIFNNVAGASAMRSKEAAKMPELVNDPIFFDIDEPDLEVYLSLPQFIQDKISSSLEFEGSLLEKLIQEHKGAGKGSTTKEDVEATQESSQSLSDTNEVEEEEDW